MFKKIMSSMERVESNIVSTVLFRTSSGYFDLSAVSVLCMSLQLSMK